MIKVIIKKPFEKPYIKEIENTLESFKKNVGGYIEIVPFYNNSLIVCNEAGKLFNLPINFVYYDINDIIVGNVVICGQDGEEFCDVPSELIENINDVFDSPFK